MALCNSVIPVFLMFLNLLHLSTQEETHPPKPFEPPLNNSVSFSFSLSAVRLSHHHSSPANFLSSLTSSPLGSNAVRPPAYRVKTSFNYSMALILSLPIGTPPQTQQIVLDTGSQLSWIQCHDKAPRKLPPVTSFDPSLSSSFSILPCNHPACKPRIPDFTLPTSCDQNQMCHYSYFYADGTLAEGNLVREKLTLSRSLSIPPLILGCATKSDEDQGILGMNRGRLSFASQSRISQFSYCAPQHQTLAKNKATGTFYLGPNPNSHTFQYINLLTFPGSQPMPNFDPLAYTIGLVGIRIGGRKLNIPPSVFRPDAGGSGQTIIDSGTQYTFLVGEAYNTVRAEIVRVVGPRLKKGYVYGGSLDMCFNGRNAMEVGILIGDMVLEFEKGVEIVVDKYRTLDDVGGGVHCVGFGRSDSLGVPSNIIGNFHQRDLWVEYDLTNRRVGFGKADCSRAV